MKRSLGTAILIPIICLSACVDSDSDGIEAESIREGATTSFVCSYIDDARHISAKVSVLSAFVEIDLSGTYKYAWPIQKPECSDIALPTARTVFDGPSQSEPEAWGFKHRLPGGNDTQLRFLLDNNKRISIPGVLTISEKAYYHMTLYLDYETLRFVNSIDPGMIVGVEMEHEGKTVLMKRESNPPHPRSRPAAATERQAESSVHSVYARRDQEYL
jgi:hypothetical protein